MLSPRQLVILQVIIDDFISTANPIGSRSLSKKEALPFSSATIRNEMADLEELGFIEKTHSSSGRVPSEKGYRFYVDHLLSPQILQQDDVHKLKSIFEERLFELEKVIRRSAKILSEMTNYTAIVLGPDVHENSLRKIQILPLDESSAVAVIVTNTGHIENKMIHLPRGFNVSEVEKVVNILNERLQGVPLTQIPVKLRTEIVNLLKQQVSNYEQMIDLFEQTLEVDKHSEKMFFGGKTNMLTQPEFNDIDKVRSLMKMIEEEAMYNILSQKPVGIHVKIGTENNNSILNECSVITATYLIGDQNIGKIAILGPKRMEYARVISLLSFFSTNLSEVLSEIYREDGKKK